MNKQELNKELLKLDILESKRIPEGEEDKLKDVDSDKVVQIYDEECKRIINESELTKEDIIIALLIKQNKSIKVISDILGFFVVLSLIGIFIILIAIS